MADNLRFLAGAGRCMEGTAAGEYGRILQLDPPRAGGRGGLDRPVELPADDGDWKIGPALATGNTVILKPSEQTPLTALRLVELAARHLPRRGANVITGHGEPVGAGIVRHPQVAMVSLTGDVGTGREIARTAAHRSRRVHLELGGKAPVVIFDDANVEGGDARHADGGLRQQRPGLHRGCEALREQRVHDCLLPSSSRRRVDEGRRAPSTRAPRWGPLMMGRAAKRVSGFVERAKATGHVEDAHGRGRRRRDGLPRQPTIIADALQDDEIVRRRGLRAGDHGDPLRRRGRGACAGPTTWTTACRRRCGRRTWAAP